MVATRTPRIVVGVDGSMTSLAAVREAVSEARRRRAELHIVHVRAPVSVKPAPGSVSSPVAAERRASANAAADAQAQGLIAASIQQAMGELPAGLDVQRIVAVGRPGPMLTERCWHDDDLLVIGNTRTRRWRHPLHRSVSRYCRAHALSPVLAVPPSR